MEGDKDVLGRADALLRRTGVGAPATGADTGGVPLLTDLVAEAAAAAPGGEAAPAEPADPAREVAARVAAQLEERLAAGLEERLARELAAQVREAVSGAIAALRPQIDEAVADAMAKAPGPPRVK